MLGIFIASDWQKESKTHGSGDNCTDCLGKDIVEIGWYIVLVVQTQRERERERERREKRSPPFQNLQSLSNAARLANHGYASYLQ